MALEYVAKERAWIALYIRCTAYGKNRLGRLYSAIVWLDGDVNDLPWLHPSISNPILF